MKDKNKLLAMKIITRGLFNDPASLGSVSAKLLINEVSAILTEHKTDLKEVQEIRPDFCEIIKDVCFLRASELITTKQAKETLTYMWDHPYYDLCQFILHTEIFDEADTSEVTALIHRLLSENMKTVEQIKSGKTNAIGFFVGQVMKAIKGKGNPAEIKEQIINAIESL